MYLSQQLHRVGVGHIISGMRACRTIRVAKRIVTAGQWKDGRMPSTAFPLRRGKGYRLAGTWRWVVHTLEADGRTYRLLIGYDRAKEQYQSWLGLDCGHDSALLARLEFHDSHGGWHCHWKIGDEDSVVRGIVRAGSHDRYRHCKGGKRQFNDQDATALAFKVFNVGAHVPAGRLL